MTCTDTADAQATLAQVCALAQAGCDIVRVSVPTEAALEGFRTICAESPVPIVADIHFNHKLAIGAVEAGAAKLRINPGNIGRLGQGRCRHRRRRRRGLCDSYRRQCRFA